MGAVVAEAVGVSAAEALGAAAVVALGISANATLTKAVTTMRARQIFFMSMVNMRGENKWISNSCLRD